MEYRAEECGGARRRNCGAHMPAASETASAIAPTIYLPTNNVNRRPDEMPARSAARRGEASRTGIDPRVLAGDWLKLAVSSGFLTE